MVHRLLLLCVLVSSAANAYLVPPSFIKPFQAKYSRAEKALIAEDMRNIERAVFWGKTPEKKPLFVATAGGPGACKSTTLETLLNEDPTFKDVAYIDPDTQALRLMINTYVESLSFYNISKADSFPKAQVDAYMHWREASNYIAFTLFNKGFLKKYSMAYGSPGECPVLETMYKNLKGAGYDIHLIMCYSPLESRLKAISHRSVTQANYQATTEDAINKGRIFLERFPLQFKYGDVLRFYWTTDFKNGSKEVARIEHNTLTIFDKDGYDAFVAQYTKDRAANGNTWPTWEALLKARHITSC